MNEYDKIQNSKKVLEQAYSMLNDDDKRFLEETAKMHNTFTLDIFARCIRICDKAFKVNFMASQISELDINK